MRFVCTISDRKIDKVRETGREKIAVSVSDKTIQVRKVTGFVRQIISMSTVIGSVCQLMTRCLSIDILEASSWNAHIRLSIEYGKPDGTPKS